MAESETLRTEAQETSARLVAGLLRREPEACAELCQCFGRRLHRYLAALLHGDVETAKDLLVQTLADAVRGLARFNPRRATFAAWLFGIARRQVQLELRRQRRRKSVPVSAQVPMEGLAEQTAEGDLAREVTDRLAARRQVAELRSVLSELEMEVLTLQYVHRLSVREVAHIVGRSERAIDSLVHRAKAKARERLVNDV